MDIENPVVRLCVEITQAEFAGRLDEAHIISMRAWEAVTDDYEACIAAHYVARFQTDPDDIFHWNQLALQHADACQRELVEMFYPSLYINMGRAYEQIGNRAEGQRYYTLASELGLHHQKERKE